MVRVCPERDAQCPHGQDCPHVNDRYSCKPGWRGSNPRTSTMTDDRVKDSVREALGDWTSVEGLVQVARIRSHSELKNCTYPSRGAAESMRDLVRDLANVVDALQAERDKLSAEVERLKAQCEADSPTWEDSAKAMQESARINLVRAETAEAKLTALEEVDFRAIALDCLERQRKSGESKEMVARWIVDEIRQALAHHSAPVGEATEPRCKKCGAQVDEHWDMCVDGGPEKHDYAAPPTTPTSAPVEDVGGLAAIMAHADAEQVRLRSKLTDPEWCPTREHYIDAASTMGAFRGAILAALSPSLIQPQALDKDELTDLISDAITDSMDMDWQARDGARAVVAALVKENIVRIKP